MFSRHSVDKRQKENEKKRRNRSCEKESEETRERKIKEEKPYLLVPSLISHFCHFHLSEHVQLILYFFLLSCFSHLIYHLTNTRISSLFFSSKYIFSSFFPPLFFQSLCCFLALHSFSLFLSPSFFSSPPFFLFSTHATSRLNNSVDL